MMFVSLVLSHTLTQPATFGLPLFHGLLTLGHSWMFVHMYIRVYHCERRFTVCECGSDGQGEGAGGHGGQCMHAMIKL